MPYPNLPKRLWPKMERCVAKVKARGGKVNPYAVCYAALKGKFKKKK
jgi:hypothetical protein